MRTAGVSKSLTGSDDTGDDTTEQGWSVAVSPGGEVTLLRIFEYQPPHHWDLTRFRP